MTQVTWEDFLRYSPLSMDVWKGPDEQYNAGARDMLTVVLALQPEVTDEMVMAAVKAHDDNKLRLPYTAMWAALRAALSVESALEDR